MQSLARGVSVVLLVLLIALLVVVEAQPQQRQCCEDYCYDTDSEKPQTAHFSTKTAYEIIKGSNSNRQYVVPNCNPQKIWILARHGTRLPSAKAMKELHELEDIRDEVVKNYEERHTKPDQGAMCEEDLELIRNWHWSPNITADYDNFLTTQGWNDLKYLARNYQAIFPSILENIYAPEKFLFRHTKTQRAEASYKAFAEGLFGANAYDHITIPAPPESDILLKPYDMCPAWDEYSDNVKKEGGEVFKFEESQEYQKMLSDVSAKLGYKFALTKKQVKNIFDMCRFDQAWYLDRPSAWCAAFTQSQINTLEYYEDLKYYYESGYGHDLNTRVGCATINDMLDHMNSKAQPNAIAYFAHTTTVQLLLTALGAAKDAVPLRADNHQEMNRRKWKSSEMTPFASNLAVIKYDCPSDAERNKIMFFLNQKPLDFDWCNVGLCNWSEVQRKYSNYKEADCSKLFCKDSGAISGAIGNVALIAGAVAMILLSRFQ